MSVRIYRLVIVLFFILISSLSSSLAGTLEKKVEKHTFKFHSGGYITVIGDEGRVSIKTWNKSEVELIVTKRAWGKNNKRP